MDHLDPFDVAIYSALYVEVAGAAAVAQHLCTAWRTDIAVVPWLGSNAGPRWALFDLSADDVDQDMIAAIAKRAVLIGRWDS